jgi:hypothetical protein
MMGFVRRLLDPTYPKHRLVTLGAAVAFAALVAFLAHRTAERMVIPGAASQPGWTMSAFRDATYFPVVAFLEGNNPYDVAHYMKTYPVGDVFPPYLPMTLVLHLPFGFLSFEAASWCYFVLTLLLTLLMARFALMAFNILPTAARVLSLATLILASRPGQSNLILGECTALVSLAVYLGLFFGRSKPLVAGVGLALASFKPTYGLPLAVAMMARRDWKAFGVGVLISAGLSLAASGIISWNVGGMTPFVQSFLGSYGASEDHPDSDPVTSPSRIDAKAVIGRVLGTDPGRAVEILLLAGILAAMAGALYRHHQRDAAQDFPLAAGVVCLSLLTCVFHQPYDLILLTLPIVGLATGASQPPWDRWPRLSAILLVLLLLPAVNYMGAATAFNALGIERGDPLWVFFASLNGVVLLAGLAICLRASL